MIYFISGTPGSGKTLFTIDLLEKEKTRPIYYYKIVLTDLGKAALPNWIPITKEELLAWESMPDNSIFLVDEAHTVFPQRTGKDKVPPAIEALAEHRHRGMDFYIIDQHPKDLDVFIRRRTYQHWHYTNVFGMDSSSKLSWQGYQDDQPDDYHAKQRAETSRHSFPKRVYPWYHSAEVHTKKKRIPWQLYAMPIMALFIAFILWSFYDFFVASEVSPESSQEPVPSESIPSSAVASSSSSSVPVAKAPVSVPALSEPPVQRPIYKDIRNAAIPDYLWNVKAAYLVGSYDVFGSVGSEYQLVLADDSTMDVDHKFFVATGAKIGVLDKKCLHRISYPSFDIFTRCLPKPSDSVQGDPDIPNGSSPPIDLAPDSSQSSLSPSLPFFGQ